MALEIPRGGCEHSWAGLAGTHVAAGGPGGAGFPQEGAYSRAWTAVDPGDKGQGLLGREGRMEE